ncbi:unnamed protein product [Symbiodinium sp. CCMP2592]|nr:unnamed protein product [Symbiodinium sp. CCMP2592]
MAPEFEWGRPRRQDCRRTRFWHSSFPELLSLLPFVAVVPVHDVTPSWRSKLPRKWNDPDHPFCPRAVDNEWLPPTILQAPVANVCAMEESAKEAAAGREGAS